ncbi:MAG: transporter substrate-binding domain-containing protein, partial [Burkholderiaceae bacterium]
ASKQLASKLKWPEGYNSPDVTFTCRRGSTACKTIEDKWPKATVRQFDDNTIAYQEVINGKAHASVADEPQPSFITLKYPAQLFTPSNELLTIAETGFGVKKGNAATVAYYNDWIDKNQDWLKQRNTYWFKTQDWAKMIP